VTSDPHQGEEIALEGENEPEAEASARFPDAAPVDSSNFEAGAQMRVSNGSGK
jgi:hypothetical protein